MDQCRLCGLDFLIENMCNLQDPDLMIELKLLEAFNVKLESNLGLPNQICFECLQKTEESVNFRNLINETQVKLLAENIPEEKFKLVVEAPEPNEPTKLTKFKTRTRQKKRSVPQSASKPQRKQLKRVIAAQIAKSNRWRNGNPVITVDDIFVHELQGVYEVEPEQLKVPDGEKNPDGTLVDDSEWSEHGWSNYEWRCIECDARLDSSRELVEHFSSEHREIKATFPCMDCKLSFKSYFSFQNHVLDHRPLLRFCCDICSEFRWNLVDLMKHRKEFHPKLRNTCLYCGKLFDSGFNLKQHIHVHMRFEEDQLYHCDLCGFKAHTKFLVKQHILTTHDKNHNELICEHCGKVCKRLADMRSHQLVHTELRPHACDVCPMTFKCKKQLYCHQRTHSQNKEEECEVCFKKFANKKRLKVHSKVHSDHFAYTCEFCGKKFKHSPGFRFHLRIHNNERPYGCSAEGCTQRFLDWSNMNKHMKSVHGTDMSKRKKNLDAVERNNVLL